MTKTSEKVAVEQTHAVEIVFSAPVELTREHQDRLIAAADAICTDYETAHPDRIMWTAGIGDRPNWNEPHEPTFDSSVFQIECAERERYETDRPARLRTHPPTKVERALLTEWVGALGDGESAIFADELGPLLHKTKSFLSASPSAESVDIEQLVHEAHAWVSDEPDIRGRYSVHGRGPTAYFSEHEEAVYEARRRNILAVIAALSTVAEQGHTGYTHVSTVAEQGEVPARPRSLNDGRDASSEAPSVTSSTSQAEQGEGEKCPCCSAPCITEAGPAHSVTLEDENGDYYTEQRLGLKTYHYVAQPSGEGA